MGKIADVLPARGDLDGPRCAEQRRVRAAAGAAAGAHEAALSLRDVRAKAVTMGKIADVLQARGDLDGALKIRREEQLPVYERLGDVREKAVTMGKIADVLFARGDLDEALHIRREEQLPVYERLGGRDLAIGRGNLAIRFSLAIRPATGRRLAVCCASRSPTRGE